MSITAETLRLQVALDAQVQQVTDHQTRALTAAWVRAWAEVSGDLQETLTELLTAQTADKMTRAIMLRSVRLRGVLGVIAGQLEDLVAGAGVTITSDLRQVVADAAAAQREILVTQLPGLVDARDLLLDVQLGDRALEAIVKRTTQQITSRLRPLSPAAYSAVRRELIRGVAVGSNPRQTAARMVKRANGQFDGGLTRALVISRTEMIDAHRAAAEHSQNQQADVLAGWIWLCHLSPRTCPSCLARHGTFHELDEPGPEDHPQGRCSRMAKVKPWTDLGFDVDEPDDAILDARAWFDALPEKDQVAILGRRRLDLLNAGVIDWADLTSKRSTPGWRDSWVVTPVSALPGQTRGRSSGGRAAS
jgi:SPP1 gp7 family putative phage head morphogenesis protein